MKEFEPIKWNLPMPSSSPRTTNTAFSGRSGTGLEMGPSVQSESYASELFSTYENIASEQREKKNPVTSGFKPDSTKPSGSNRDSATRNITGQTPKFSLPQSPLSGQNYSQEIETTRQSPGGILTQEGAQQVDAAGFGPIASMQSPPGQESPASSIDVGNKTLYNQTANVISAQEAKGPEKMPEAPATPMPPAQSFPGKNISPPSLGGGNDKNTTLIQIAASKSMYPPWMIQGLMG